MSTDARGCEVKGEKDGITWPRKAALSALCHEWTKDPPKSYLPVRIQSSFAISNRSVLVL